MFWAGAAASTKVKGPEVGCSGVRNSNKPQADETCTFLWKLGFCSKLAI